MKPLITRFALWTLITSLLALAGCAVSPEEERRRLDMEADIDEILTYELDKEEYGEVRNCLSTNEYRSMRALGDRHLLFEGRNDKQWVNVLRGRCRGLDEDSRFVMKPSMSGQTCDKDQFEIADYLDSRMAGGMGPTCALGQFKPVAKAQVGEIEDRLEMR